MSGDADRDPKRSPSQESRTCHALDPRLPRRGVRAPEAPARRSSRPAVMLEAEDQRAAEEAGDRDERRRDKQRSPEPDSGSLAIGMATPFAQYQHQHSTGDRGGSQPTMRRLHPGGVGESKTAQEPTEDAGDHRGDGGEPDAIARNG